MTIYLIYTPRIVNCMPILKSKFICFNPCLIIQSVHCLQIDEPEWRDKICSLTSKRPALATFGQRANKEVRRPHCCVRIICVCALSSKAAEADSCGAFSTQIAKWAARPASAGVFYVCVCVTGGWASGGWALLRSPSGCRRIAMWATHAHVYYVRFIWWPGPHHHTCLILRSSRPGFRPSLKRSENAPDIYTLPVLCNYCVRRGEREHRAAYNFGRPDFNYMRSFVNETLSCAFYTVWMSKATRSASWFDICWAQSRLNYDGGCAHLE